MLLFCSARVPNMSQVAMNHNLLKNLLKNEAIAGVFAGVLCNFLE